MKSTKKRGFKLPTYAAAGMYTDPNVTGANAYGSTEANPYYKANMDSQNKLAAQQGTEMQMNAASDQVIKQIPGFGQYYGMAKGASDMGRNMIGKDENGYAHSNMEQAADNFMNPTHQSITANASKGQHGEALMSAFINPAIGSIAGEVFKGTKFGDKATAYGRGEKVFKEGGTFNLMHPFNNPNFNLPMFPMGGNMEFGGNAYKYPDGGKKPLMNLTNDEVLQLAKEQRGYLDIRPGGYASSMKPFTESRAEYPHKDSWSMEGSYIKHSTPYKDLTPTDIWRVNRAMGYVSPQSWGTAISNELYSPNIRKMTYSDGGEYNGIIHAPELGGYFRKRSK